MTDEASIEFILGLADDRLVLGHRLSEWCGHGPILEEDIALANIALDLIGQATSLFRLAGELEARGRSEDDLAYFREAIEFRNVLMVELPKGDFAFTVVRQLLFSVYAVLEMEALTASTNATLAGIASKALKEHRYHVRHARQWMVTLGDGTEESHRRVQHAVNDLWRFTGELFMASGAGGALVIDRSRLQHAWHQHVASALADATLATPAAAYMQHGGRSGRHSEHLGHLLAEMQIVARSNPGARW